MNKSLKISRVVAVLILIQHNVFCGDNEVTEYERETNGYPDPYNKNNNEIEEYKAENHNKQIIRREIDELYNGRHQKYYTSDNDYNDHPDNKIIPQVRKKNDELKEGSDLDEAMYDKESYYNSLRHRIPGSNAYNSKYNEDEELYRGKDEELFELSDILKDSNVENYVTHERNATNDEYPDNNVFKDNENDKLNETSLIESKTVSSVRIDEKIKSNIKYNKNEQTGVTKKGEEESKNYVEENETEDEDERKFGDDGNYDNFDKDSIAKPEEYVNYDKSNDDENNAKKKDNYKSKVKIYDKKVHRLGNVRNDKVNATLKPGHKKYNPEKDRKKDEDFGVFLPKSIDVIDRLNKSDKNGLPHGRKHDKKISEISDSVQEEILQGRYPHRYKSASKDIAIPQRQGKIKTRVLIKNRHEYGEKYSPHLNEEDADHAEKQNEDRHQPSQKHHNKHRIHSKESQSRKKKPYPRRPNNKSASNERRRYKHRHSDDNNFMENDYDAVFPAYNNPKYFNGIIGKNSNKKHLKMLQKETFEKFPAKNLQDMNLKNQINKLFRNKPYQFTKDQENFDLDENFVDQPEHLVASHETKGAKIAVKASKDEKFDKPRAREVPQSYVDDLAPVYSINNSQERANYSLNLSNTSIIMLKPYKSSSEDNLGDKMTMVRPGQSTDFQNFVEEEGEDEEKSCKNSGFFKSDLSDLEGSHGIKNRDLHKENYEDDNFYEQMKRSVGNGVLPGLRRKDYDEESNDYKDDKDQSSDLGGNRVNTSNVKSVQTKNTKDYESADYNDNHDDVVSGEVPRNLKGEDESNKGNKLGDDFYDNHKAESMEQEVSPAKQQKTVVKESHPVKNVEDKANPDVKNSDSKSKAKGKISSKAKKSKSKLLKASTKEPGGGLQPGLKKVISEVGVSLKAGDFTKKPDSHCHPPAGPPKFRWCASDREPVKDKEYEDALKGKVAARIVEVIQAKVKKSSKLTNDFGQCKNQKKTQGGDVNEQCPKQNKDSALKGDALKEIMAEIEKSNSNGCNKLPQKLKEFLEWMVKVGPVRSTRNKYQNPSYNCSAGSSAFLFHKYNIGSMNAYHEPNLASKNELEENKDKPNNVRNFYENSINYDELESKTDAENTDVKKTDENDRLSRGESEDKNRRDINEEWKVDPENELDATTSESSFVNRPQDFQAPDDPVDMISKSLTDEEVRMYSPYKNQDLLNEPPEMYHEKSGNDYTRKCELGITQDESKPLNHPDAQKLQEKFTVEECDRSHDLLQLYEYEEPIQMRRKRNEQRAWLSELMVNGNLEDYHETLPGHVLNDALANDEATSQKVGSENVNNNDELLGFDTPIIIPVPDSHSEENDTPIT